MLDGAILVLDSGKGVQSQSITVDKQMKRYRVPRIAFVNKMDNPGANYERVADHAQGEARPPPGQAPGPHGRRRSRSRASSTRSSARRTSSTAKTARTSARRRFPAEYAEQAAEARDEIIQEVADVDDELAEKFLDEEPVSNDELRAAIRRATLALKMTPVMCGIGRSRTRACSSCSTASSHYLPNPTEVVNEAHDQSNNEAKIVIESDPNKPFVGLAFKLQTGQVRAAHVLPRLPGHGRQGRHHLQHQQRDAQGARPAHVPHALGQIARRSTSAEAGDIVAFYGVEASSGETFTDGKVNVTLTSMHVPAAVISLAVAPKDRAAEANFSKALNRFTKEDPTFRVHQDEESQQTIISGMGELHLDIYMERMRREYNCDVIAGKPQVAYRETITQRAEINYTHKKQTGGSGQYAKVMRLHRAAPGGRGGDVRVRRRRRGRLDPPRVHPVVRQGLPGGVKKGTLIGFPVVGIRCAVNDGASHAVDSSEMAFKTAALMGFREAYAEAGADHPRADHEGGDRRARSSSRARSSARSTSAAASSWRRSPATTSASVRGAAQRHVRLLDRSPLGDPGQGHLHDGVRQVRRRAEAGAGRDDEEVPREARRRAQVRH